MQKVFVVLSGLFFIEIILIVALRVFGSKAPQEPMGQMISVAGLLLGAASFRDLIGLSHLASFGSGDALVIGIPLLILLFAFFRTALPRRADRVGEEVEI